MEYTLLPLYQASFPSMELIEYRQQVAKDLEKPDFYASVKRFETGMHSVREYLIHLEREIRGIKEALATIHYAVLVSGGTVRIRKYEDEIDYTADVEASFKKFQTREGKSYLVSFTDSADMNSVEEKILLAVARLYGEIFNRLNSFYTVNQVFQVLLSGDFGKR